MIASQVTIDGWVATQNMAYTYNAISSSLKTERNSDICYNMEELLGHHAK